jgi:hypothetical protein
VEIKVETQFTIIDKVVINLSTVVKYLYNEKCTIMIENTDWDSHRYSPQTWIGRINIVQMSILPKGIYRFCAIPMNTNGIHHRSRKK